MPPIVVVVIVIALSYDYCLTFSEEVTYIWQRPWTRVSTLFLLVRYMGWLYAFTVSLGSSSFIPGPVSVQTCNILYALSELSYAIFWTGADMVMILRVYALFHRSRIILGGLFVLYITEVVILVVGASIYSDPKYVQVTIVRLLGITVCNPVPNTETWNTATAIVQFIHGTVLSFLVVAKFVRDSLRTYQATRKWQFNKYISLLVRDGFLYFLVTLFNSLINLLGVLGTFSGTRTGPALIAVATVPLFTLTPRFIMNIRELYVRDSQGRWDRDIDTGFGLSNGAGIGVGVSTTIGTIAFAEGVTIGESEDSQERAEASGQGSDGLVIQNGDLEGRAALIGG